MTSLGFYFNQFCEPIVLCRITQPHDADPSFRVVQGWNLTTKEFISKQDGPNLESEIIPMNDKKHLQYAASLAHSLVISRKQKFEEVQPLERFLEKSSDIKPTLMIGIYEHKSGHRYEVLGVAFDATNLMPVRYVVVYRPLGSKEFFIRDYDEFCDEGRFTFKGPMP